VKINNIKMVWGFNVEEEVEDFKPELYVVTTSWRCGICFVGKYLLCFWFEDACKRLTWFKVVAG
jgi:hypothetical protein